MKKLGTDTPCSSRVNVSRTVFNTLMLSPSPETNRRSQFQNRLWRTSEVSSIDGFVIAGSSPVEKMLLLIVDATSGGGDGR